MNPLGNYSGHKGPRSDRNLWRVVLGYLLMYVVVAVIVYAIVVAFKAAA